MWTVTSRPFLHYKCTSLLDSKILVCVAGFCPRELHISSSTSVRCISTLHPCTKSWWTVYYDSAPRFYKEAYYPSKLWKLETKALQYENCQSVGNSNRGSPNRIRNAPYDPLPYSFPFLKTQDWVITKILYENLAPMKVSCINDVWHSQAIIVRNIQPPCL